MLQAVTTKIQSLLPAKKIKITNEDRLLFSTVPYYLLATLQLIGFSYGLESSFILLFIAYTLLPILDEYFSLDLKNPTEQQRKELERNDIFFKLALYVTVIIDWFVFLRVMVIFSNLEFSFTTLVNLASFIFIFSNVNAVQFAVAHQIFHKTDKFHRWLGTIHMVKNLYIHFTYEHLYGHHRRVATPEDPASAEKGISVYQFFPRSFFGSYKSVYEMETERKKPIFLNAAVLSVVASTIFTIFIFKFFGTQAGVLFLIEAFGSIYYLEAINYIEHYGLRRQKLPNGQYEKVTIRHSWNAPHRFTNYLLFKLQRHSDHHENSLKPYQTLVSMQQSPHLPHGYTVCIIMSFFPKTWFRIMDPLVDYYNQTKKGEIDGEVMAKAVKETKKFIIGVSFFTGLAVLLWVTTVIF